jgi:hypothetical protein
VAITAFGVLLSYTGNPAPVALAVMGFGTLGLGMIGLMDRRFARAVPRDTTGTPVAHVLI